MKLFNKQKTKNSGEELLATRYSLLSSEKGQLSVVILFFAAVTVVLVSGFVFLAGSFLQLSTRSLNKAQAFEIAEAGIEYYRWHLSHAPLDYEDGTGAAGPYVHTYYNKSGTAVGQFVLDITPPENSLAVAVKSTGKVFSDSSIVKVIKVVLAPSTFLQYNIVTHDTLQIGSTTTIYGPILANDGIRFDGFAANLVQSAQTTYGDPSHGGQDEWAVHTHVSPVDPSPPTALPLRPDIFAVGRKVGVPAVDFTSLSQVLSNLSALAQSGGVYASSSGAFGYDLAFSTSSPNASTTYALYKVTALASPPNGCTNTSHVDGWGTWSIGSEVLVSSGTIPANKTFFVADNLWVRGQVNKARVNVGAAVFPDNSATWASVSVNNDLRYTNYDGSDSVLVVAQNNINVGLMSNDTLRIDAALLTEHGRVGRFYYQPPNNQNNNNKCAPYGVRSKITIFGSIVTYQAYQFGFDDGSGYADRQILYDANLYYNPPSILLSLSNGMNIISWQEVK